MKLALLLAGVLALSPSPSLAETVTGTAQGVLYEVLEAPGAEFTPSGARIMPGVILPSGDRLAQAEEAGTLSGSGTLAFLTGDVTVNAQSRVPFDPATGFGVGTADGYFRVSNTGGTVTGKLEGQLNMSLLTSTQCGGNPCPFAPITGMWSTLGDDRSNGMFSGVFLVPFEAAPGTWAYLNPSTRQVELLQPHEFDTKTGSPLIKLFVTLYQ